IAPLPESLLREFDRPMPRRARKVPLGTGNWRYGEAALGSEGRAVREARPGQRDSTLNRSAFFPGQLVTPGLLARDAVEAELTEAALSAGLGEREVAATLKSGLEAGILRPRETRG